MNTAILLMGGEGKRFGSGVPKQFHLLGGKKVYQHALETLLESGLFEEIILVCHKDWIESAAAPSNVRIIEGGATRQESSWRGILASRGEIVLIHDAVRPFVSIEILRENVRLANEHGAVDTCIPSADTLVYAPDGIKIESIPERKSLMRGQTPQTFKREWILEAHEKTKEKNASDDCRLILELGKSVWIANGAERNMKITTDLDLWIAEDMLERV